ncbi:tetratricopeptide repeat protein [bacterium]|nr:MAG: tetratricopeptide repeat protein [bacterium]
MTAPNSTYCPRDRWTLLADLPGADSPGGAFIDFDIPTGTAGFMARRRQEGSRDQLERNYRSNLERRLDALEKRLAGEPENPAIHRAMGLMAMLENQNERANAFFERAYELDPEDYEVHVNYAIALAKRGQLQPALKILTEGRAKWPDAPLLLFNLALIALAARRPALVHDAVGALEKLWLANPAIAQDFHDDAVSARGLAFLQENKAREAMRELLAAAQHTVNLRQNASASQTLPGATEEDDMQIDMPVLHDEAGELHLEGKTAEADALNNLALAEAEQGDIDKAIARLRTALRLEPGHPQVLGNLGVLAYRQGRLDVAFKYLDTARQIEEYLGVGDPVTWNHLGVVLSAMGRLEEGLENFQRAGSAEHAEFEVFYNLGRAFIEHNKPDLGVQYLRQSFAIEPNDADVHTVLGAAYLLRGRTQLYGEALKHLKRALQINAHHRTAATNLALALVEIRNLDAAGKLLAQELKLFPRDAEALYMSGLLTLENAGSVNTEENVWVSAAQRFDGAFSSRPDVSAALYNSALCQFMMGFRDTSSKLLEAATQRDPSLGPAYYLIGFGHAVGKRDVEALKAWQVAAQFENDNPDLHANMAALLYRKGDFEGAARSYMNAHRLLPSDASILACLGVAFAQRKMYNQAITALEQSLTLNARSPMAYSNLGLAYYLFKNVEKAMENWRMVSRLDSKYAAEREEEQQRSFDDSVIQLRPVSWRERIVQMAPVLPRPQTRLLPGTNARTYRPAISDTSLNEIAVQKREVERLSRMLAWMHIKS